MVSPSRRALVDELDRYGRLLEVGIGDRWDVARALADRGRDVVAIDVDESIQRSAVDPRGSLLIRRRDVVAIAAADDPLAALGGPEATGSVGGFDVVYGVHLPAEIQRPTVVLAERIGADCLFTTLGFEEPIVPVERRTVAGVTVHVARRSGRDN